MGDSKGPPHRFSGGAARPFIQRDAHFIRAHGAQINPFGHCGLHHRFLQYPDIYGDRVKKRLRLYFEPRSFQAFGQPHGFTMDPLRDGFQAFRAMKHRIKGRHHRQKRLRCADV